METQANPTIVPSPTKAPNSATSPFISVVIATKDGSAHIAKALDSILAQSLVKADPNSVEIIVVSDGSTDTTAHVVRTYIAGFPNQSIQLVELEQNIGPGPARNLGVKQAHGTYIAFLDDDDIWQSPDKLKVQKEYLDMHPGTAVVGASHVHFIRERKAGKDTAKDTTPKNIVGNKTNGDWLLVNETDPEKIHANMLAYNPLITSSVLLRKDMFDQIGGFKPMYLAEDYDLWLRMGTVGKIANVDGADIAYLVRDGGASRSNRIKMCRVVITLAKEYHGSYPRYYKALMKGYVRLALAILKSL